MIRHVVMFRWKPEVDAAHVAATEAALSRLPGLIPVIRSYSYGADVRIVDTNFDFAVTAQFDSADDFVVYRDHPDHQAFVQQYVGPFVDQRCAVQFSEP